MTLSGLVVPTPTLFNDDGDLDPDRNAEFIAGLVRAGVDHLFPLGSLGEFPSVEEPERRGLLDAVADATRGATDLWVGIGAPTTRRAVARAREALDVGADALVAVPPYYLHPTEAAVAEYYRGIQRAVELPLFAYNIPSLVGYALTPRLVHDLAVEGVIVGVKDTSGSLESVRGFLTGAPAGFSVFPGDDVLASSAIAAGAAGAVMGLANIVPRLALAVVRSAARPGDTENARHQAVLDRLAKVVALGPFPATGKFLARTLRGAPDGYRAPYGPLTDEESHAVVTALAPLRNELEPYLREGGA